jgi:hypothetical protein
MYNSFISFTVLIKHNAEAPSDTRKTQCNQLHLGP